MINIEITDLDKFDISDLEKLLHKNVDDCMAKLFGRSPKYPDDNDYFTYNEVRACMLGYAGAPGYFVTERGDVYRQFKNGAVKYVKPMFMLGGWRVVTSNKSKVKRLTLHKIVAECFVYNPFGYKTVRFIDGDMNNYKAMNLEWSDNKGYRAASNKRGPKPRPIEIYDRNGDKVAEYETATQCAKDRGWSNSSISMVLTGRKKTLHGYTLKYKEDIV